MMDRRVFLKLTGLVAAASALDALPVAAASSPHAPSAADRSRDLAGAAASPVSRLAIREPGTYRISGLVRLQEPLVEISGITNSQMISWSRVEGSKPPVASFMSFERFDAPGMTPDIQVRGGHLEALAVVPMDLE
jgi:hypothetical protein